MGVLQGAGTGAAIGSAIPGIGTAAGAIAGGIIGLGQTIGGWISGENKEKKQREHEKEMMGLQYQYNEAAANNNMTRALEMWRKTGYEAQGQQIENAGLNKALMYGGGGASATSQSQGNSGVNNTGTQAVAMGLQARAIEAEVSNTEADTALKIAQAAKEAGEASKKPIELKIEQTNKEITDLEKNLKAQNVEIGANEIVRTTAVAQKAMEELNQAMMETEIKKETKDAIIESTIKNVTNLEVQIALGVAKTKETNRNIEAIGEQLEALKKDVITRRITAEAAKENAKTLGERLIKEIEVKGQELELQEKRMILDAIQGGVDSMLKFGFLKKKGGK